jgi:uncharacterized membrane protein YkoI
MFIRISLRGLLATGALLVCASQLDAQGPPASTTPKSTIAAARITKDAASTTAVKQVPGGRLQTISLGMVAGKLAYTAFVTEAAKPGRTTVVIDANTGAVISKRP